MVVHYGVLVFLAVLATVWASQCGVTYVPPNIRGRGQRIVGGTEALVNSYPWMASIQRPIAKRTPEHFCGATLVRASETAESSDIVITAAHCFATEHAAGHYVLFGGHYQSKEIPGQQLVPVTRIVRHHLWNSSTVANDIAVLKLERPVQFTKTIQPACLPVQGEQLKDGEMGIVTGWGLTQENGNTSEALQQAAVPVYNVQQCTADLKKKSKLPLNPQLQFCAGYPQGAIDSCSQDSGGPYVVRNANNRYVLHGIVSFGIGCAQPNAPGIYTKVSSYIPWIKEEMKELSSLK